MAPPRTPVRERFLARVGAEFGDECAEWPGTCGTPGYGVITDDNRRRVGTHRVSYEVFNGPIPDGLHVLHRCDNPPCVNPGHLFVGTPKDNAEDRQRKGRHTPPVFRVRDEHPRTKIPTSEIRNIRSRVTFRPDSNVAALADEYGVTPQAIYTIVKGLR